MPSTDLADAVAAAFGLGAARSLEGPVARGQLGQVWRLEAAEGPVAVKEAFGSVSAEEAEADAAYQDVVHAAGVPMPRVLRTVDGTVLAEIDGHQVRAYTWVEVEPLDRSGYDVAAVGRLVAAVHRVHVPAPGPVDPWYTRPVGRPAWAGLVRRLRSSAAPYADELADLVPEIVAAEAWIGGVEAVQLCHCDLWSDNIRHTRGGDLVVLDWENAGPGDPSQELGPMLYEFGLADPARTAALHAAYVDAGGPGRLVGPESLGMLVAQLGHILEYGCEAWLTSTSDAEREHNEAWVREYLTDPPTTPRLLGILAAAGA